MHLFDNAGYKYNWQDTSLKNTPVYKVFQNSPSREAIIYNTDLRTYPDVMTKIPRIDGLTYFLTHSAPRAASPPELRY